MAPSINTDLKTIEKNNNSHKTENQAGYDFSSINIGEIMLNGSESEKTKLLSLLKESDVSPLRLYIEAVKAHNKPIKEEIAFWKDEIHASRREISELKRAYKKTEDLDEQAELKSMISNEKRNLWTMCCANVRRAFTLA